MPAETFHGTTVIAVRRNGAVAMAGDGQVTMGNTVMKSNARKIRKIFDGKILVGFAGATADAFTLFERFEGKVKEYGGDITRAAVELAKDWRTDRILRRLEALLLVADKQGHVPHLRHRGRDRAGRRGHRHRLRRQLTPTRRRAPTWTPPTLGAREIAEKSLRIAAGICIYTNQEVVVEELA